MNLKENLRNATAFTLLSAAAIYCGRGDGAQEIIQTPTPTDVPVRELQFMRPKNTPEPTGTATLVPTQEPTPTPLPTLEPTPTFTPLPAVAPLATRRPAPTPTVIIIREPAPTPTPELVQGLNYEWAQRLIDLTNEERVKRGLLAFSINDDLMDATEKYAEALFKSGERTHNLGGTTPTGRAQEEGYNGVVGEVAASGVSIDNSSAMVQSLVSSPAHSEIILTADPDAKHIGTGCYQGYIRQIDGSLYFMGVCVEDIGFPYE